MHRLTFAAIVSASDLEHPAAMPGRFAAARTSRVCPTMDANGDNTPALGLLSTGHDGGRVAGQIKFTTVSVYSRQLSSGTIHFLGYYVLEQGSPDPISSSALTMIIKVIRDSYPNYQRSPEPAIQISLRHLILVDNFPSYFSNKDAAIQPPVFGSLRPR